MEVESGDDLFALALLMATFSDWLMICQVTVPVVCEGEFVRRGW